MFIKGLIDSFHYIKLTNQLSFKINFQKVNKHIGGGEWLIQSTKRRKGKQLQSLKLPLMLILTTKAKQWYSISEQHPPRNKSWFWFMIPWHHIITSSIIFKVLKSKSYASPAIMFIDHDQSTPYKRLASGLCLGHSSARVARLLCAYYKYIAT